MLALIVNMTFLKIGSRLNLGKGPIINVKRARLQDRALWAVFVWMLLTFGLHQQPRMWGSLIIS